MEHWRFVNSTCLIEIDPSTNKIPVHVVDPGFTGSLRATVKRACVFRYRWLRVVRLSAGLNCCWFRTSMSVLLDWNILSPARNIEVQEMFYPAQNPPGTSLACPRVLVPCPHNIPLSNPSLIPPHTLITPVVPSELHGIESCPLALPGS